MLAAIGFAVGVMLAQASAAPAQAEDLRALAVQFADGSRTVRPLVTPGRLNWAYAFPRIAGAETSRYDLPLAALQYEEALEPGGVAVTVTLLYGKPTEWRVPVATVHVTGPDPVRVDALEKFGVQPVTFALVAIPRAHLSLPSVTTRSSNLEASSVEAVTGPSPAYRVTIVNHGTRDVMMVHFTSYHGQTPGTSGRPRGVDGQPLIRRGNAYVLLVSEPPVTGGDGVTQWGQTDRIDIDLVLWSNDVVEGNAKVAAADHARDAGAALQLDRILAVLRDAVKHPGAHAPADLRARIAALPLVVTTEEADAEAEAAAAAIPGSARLPVAQINSRMTDGMNGAHAAVLTEFDALMQAPPVTEPPEYAAWLSRIVEKYTDWRGRIR